VRPGLVAIDQPIGNDDFDLAEGRVGCLGNRFAPHETAARLPGAAVTPAGRRPGWFQLRSGKAVLRDPQRQSALLQHRGAVGRLRDRAHSGRQRDSQHGERDENFD